MPGLGREICLGGWPHSSEILTHHHHCCLSPPIRGWGLALLGKPLMCVFLPRWQPGPPHPDRHLWSPVHRPCAALPRGKCSSQLVIWYHQITMKGGGRIPDKLTKTHKENTALSLAGVTFSDFKWLRAGAKDVYQGSRGLRWGLFHAWWSWECLEQEGAGKMVQSHLHLLRPGPVLLPGSGV